MRELIFFFIFLSPTRPCDISRKGCSLSRGQRIRDWLQIKTTNRYTAYVRRALCEDDITRWHNFIVVCEKQISAQIKNVDLRIVEMRRWFFWIRLVCCIHSAPPPIVCNPRQSRVFSVFSWSQLYTPLTPPPPLMTFTDKLRRYWNFYGSISASQIIWLGDLCLTLETVARDFHGISSNFHFIILQCNRSKSLASLCKESEEIGSGLSHDYLIYLRIRTLQQMNEVSEREPNSKWNTLFFSSILISIQLLIPPLLITLTSNYNTYSVHGR